MAHCVAQLKPHVSSTEQELISCISEERKNRNTNHNGEKSTCGQLRKYIYSINHLFHNSVNSQLYSVYVKSVSSI